jgi:hypothetical protein
LKPVHHIVASSTEAETGGALDTGFDSFKLHRHTMVCRFSPAVQWRKMKLKVKLEGSLSHFSFKRLAPGPFNMGFIGSTCTALPRR